MTDAVTGGCVVKLILDEETGDLILPIPDSIMEAAGISPGDVVRWTDNGNGTWSIKKAEMRVLKEHEVCPTKSPSDEEIRAYMRDHGVEWSDARERLLEMAHGGLPPHGYACWDDYWKAL